MKSSLWYAQDKSMYDALCNRKVRNEQLQELFYSRGVIHSKATSREKLAECFCRLSHDYYDHQNIANTFATGVGREKMTVSFIDQSIGDEELELSLKAVEQLLQKAGDKASLTSQGQAKELNVGYEVFDTNKTEFKQVIKREATISIEASDQGVLIRSPNNEKVELIKKMILDSISTRVATESNVLDVSEIELHGIEDPKCVSDFFLGLINGMSDVSLESVTGIEVFNPETSSDENDKTPHIKKLSLSGQQVSLTQELRNSIKDGFYICAIVWDCTFDVVGSDLYTLEAKFSSPKEKNGFSYLARSMRKHKGGVEHNKTTSRLSAFDELRLHRLIEGAARNQLNRITKELHESS